MDELIWMQLLYMHVLSRCPREPGPPETVDFHVSLEPGRGAAFACDGPGKMAGAPNQTSARCMR